MSFQGNLVVMSAIDHLSGLDIPSKEGNVVHHIPNAPGKQGSLKLYHALTQEFNGKLDAAVVEHGLAWFAGRVVDAGANPSKHSNTDLLFKVKVEDASSVLKLLAV